jgi:hypothetical protein
LRDERRKSPMLLKLCGCLGGQGDDNNNNKSNKKQQPPASETGCLMCCCCPCLFRCRHRASTHPQDFKKEEETSDDEMGTKASTPVISMSPPLNKYVIETKRYSLTTVAIRRSVPHSSERF